VGNRSLLARLRFRLRVFRRTHSPRWIEGEARKAIQEGRVTRDGNDILFDGEPMRAYKPLFAHLLKESESSESGRGR
jgi:hypothetical protein